MSNEIKIKKGFKLGELDAEADVDLLTKCFVDIGLIDQLTNIHSPKSLVLGRTGAGKSALLLQISARAEHTSQLDPNDISIRFLEHSNIIQFFNEIGVKLDLFYRMLWRHILTVELLKLRYDLRSEAENKSFLERMYIWVERDNVKQRALNYFTEWGDKFWLETDEQLRELTRKFTSDVRAQLGSKFKAVDVSLEGAKGLSEESRTEIRSLATQVVSGIQIKRLNEVLDLLAEYAFEDKQKEYFVLIDRLDEDWAETDTRCRFIRALIEETKSLRRIPQVKIVTALRRDLLDLVFDKTRDSGFQEEKYEAYLAPLQWGKEDLINLLETRVTEVYKRQYTSETVTFPEVFPRKEKHGSDRAIDYIIDRTLLRPRDALQFANECFSIAADRPRISWRAIHGAEAKYSQKRYKSLIEEWSEYYPALSKSFELLRGLPTPFVRSNITSERVEEVSMELCESLSDKTDKCIIAANKLYAASGSISEADFISELLMCFYHMGIIGVKISTLETYRWAYIDQPRISKSEVKRSNQIVVHKMLGHSLEIRDENITKQGNRTR